MKKFILLVLTLSLVGVNGFSRRKTKQLYKLPSTTSLPPPVVEDVNSNKTVATRPLSDRVFLVGTSEGLFKITSENKVLPLWTAGSVEQILDTYSNDNTNNEKNIETSDKENTATTNEENKKTVWYFRTSEGVLYSEDLENFTLCNEGLPKLVIKEYNGQDTSFKEVIHTLKDLSVNPFNPLQLVTATKDEVFLTQDGGKLWHSIGSASKNTSGLKAVAITSMLNGEQKETVAFMSHPIFGLSYIRLEAKNPMWVDVSSGFDLMPSMTQPDEISDILPVKKIDSEGKITSEVYLSQTYIPRIYKFNWGAKRGELIYKGEEPADTIDGLSMITQKTGGNNTDILLYTKNETLGSLDTITLKSPGTPEKLNEWKEAFSAVKGTINTAWIPMEKSGLDSNLCLNELWLLYPGSINTKYATTANNIKCVYASAYQCRLQSGIDKFKKIIKENKLNGLVIDMKDDYGLLRYETQDPYVKSMAKVTQYKVDIDHFIEEFKKDNVYLVARIVVFKDRNLGNYGGGKFAVWNYKTNTQWVGLKGYEDVLDEEGQVIDKTPTYYDELWVDPYCPIVWEYNVAIAKELISKGFDEIQFDYIRFPTDGLNLGSTSYRWKSQGMDKEGALTSFLRYARANIDAPIGIDIYGANGWYRSGTRTGQDVEMLCEYVDVIGPMFYPSHFEQGFLDIPPYADRTYRIYYYGTYRNTVMARNRVIVRPWVQAFKLNVRYDRQYYNNEYVIKQVYGVRDSVNRGYMYWNNAGNYDTISPDVSEEDKYIGDAPEADLKFRKPALGKEKALLLDKEDSISVMDNLYYTFQEDKEYRYKVFTPLLNVAQ